MLGPRVVIDKDAKKNCRENVFLYRCAKLYNFYMQAHALLFTLHILEWMHAAVRLLDFASDEFDFIAVWSLCRAL